MSSTSTGVKALPDAATASAGPIKLGPSKAQVFAQYLLGMGIALVPLALLYNDFYWINILTFAYLMAGLASAWNIIGGFGGQFSLAHGVFFGVGAYFAGQMYLIYWTLALARDARRCRARRRHRGVDFLADLPPARPVLRHRDHGLQRSRRGLCQLFGIAHRRRARPADPVPRQLRQHDLRRALEVALLMFAYMAFVAGISVAIRHSRLGYYLLSVREDEDSARASGVNVVAVKLWGMAISAALTAMGGTLFAMFIRFLDPPTLFSLPEVGVKFALLSLIGGVGTIWGPLLGAALVDSAGEFHTRHLGRAARRAPRRPRHCC